MNQISWDNIVSLSVVFLYFVPWLQYFKTKHLNDLTPFWGLLGTIALNESIKHCLIGKASPRPANAYDCNLCVNDGPQGGRPGMPSGHSAQVSFFAGYYLQTISSNPIRLLLLFYAALVMLSRYTKSCHTVPQIMSGSVLGFVMSYLVVRHL